MSFELSRADKDSPLWRALEAHYRNRLQSLRAQNDATQTPEKTERLRGQIFECKALLGLAEDRPIAA
jgi:hypothetical protein